MKKRNLIIKDYQIIMASIYKIKSTLGNEVYIGSTTQKLYQRMSKHRYAYTSQKENYMSKIIFEKYGIDNTFIELIEEISLEERFSKEQYYIDNIEYCINKNKAYRTEDEIKISEEKEQQRKHEWYLNKKEEDPIAYNKHQCEIQKRFYENHREELLEKSKEYYQEHIEEKKIYNQQHWEKYKHTDGAKKKTERLLESINCDKCGISTLRANLSRHKKSLKCINHI